MKRIMIMVPVILFFCISCHEVTVGYLETEGAAYLPDTMYIYKNPDPVKEAVRIQFNSPWQTTSLQGYAGTNQIFFSVEEIRAVDGDEEACRIFAEELSMRASHLLYPLKNCAKPGTYVVSIRVTNEGYSKVVKDAMTFIVME